MNARASWRIRPAMSAFHPANTLASFSRASISPMRSHWSWKSAIADARLRVGEHALHLGGDVRVAGQPPALGGGEQRVVGHAAPQQVRQPGRHLPVAHAHHLRLAHRRAGRGVLDGDLRIAAHRLSAELDAIKELGRLQHGGDHQPDAGLEVGRLAGVEHGLQDRGVVGVQRPAIRAPAKRGDEARPHASTSVAVCVHGTSAVQ